MLRNLLLGFSTPLNGLRYLKSRPKLLGLAIIPFLINTIAILIALGVVINNSHWVDALVTHVFINAATAWYYWLAQKLFKVLVWMALIIFVIIAAYLLAQLIASPFSSLLSERTLISAGGLIDKPFQLRSWLSLSGRMLKVSLVKAILFLFIGGILFVISLVPVISLLAHLCLLLILAFDSADYSFENLGFSFGQRVRFFFANLSRFVGFAVALGLILLIPGLNFFLFPASIVGASLMITSVRKEQDNGH